MCVHEDLDFIRFTKWEITKSASRVLGSKPNRHDTLEEIKPNIEN